MNDTVSRKAAKIRKGRHEILQPVLNPAVSCPLYPVSCPLMSDKVTVYQKPTCSKCRTAIQTLKERGIEFEAINYYEKPLSATELRELLAKLGVGPRDILRKGETVYRDLNIAGRDLSDDELIELMVQNPDLIQRPIVVKGDSAVLARPIENLDELF